jgi:hypothetical protein
MHMKKTAALSALLLALPFVAFAQTFGSILGVINSLVNELIPLTMALALLAFFWGLVKYIWNSGNEESKADGKKIMIAGIVGLFVMISIWGLVGIIAQTFGVRTGGTQAPPSVGGAGGTYFRP